MFCVFLCHWWSCLSALVPAAGLGQSIFQSKVSGLPGFPEYFPGLPEELDSHFRVCRAHDSPPFLTPPVTRIPIVQLRRSLHRTTVLFLTRFFSPCYGIPLRFVRLVALPVDRVAGASSLSPGCYRVLTVDFRTCDCPRLCWTRSPTSRLTLLPPVPKSPFHLAL